MLGIHADKIGNVASNKRLLRILQSLVSEHLLLFPLFLFACFFSLTWKRERKKKPIRFGQ